MELLTMRAYQMWAVLTYAASKSQVVTYDELSRATGLVRPKVGKALEKLQKYCKAQKLPPITALVVSTQTGKPTNWGEKDMEKWPAILHDIHKRKWSAKDAPRSDALK